MPVRSARLHARRRPPRRYTKLRRIAVVGLGGLSAVPLVLDGPARAVDHGNGQVYTLGTAPHLGGAAGKPITALTRTPSGQGYWMGSTAGEVFAYGDAQYLGAPGSGLRAPIVDMAATSSGKGYWMVGADGGVFSFGDAPFAGSLGGLRMNVAASGIAATPTGKGYWMVAKDGGVFAFGDAPFLGSAAGTPLNAPVVAIAATPSGKGYRLLARDGGVFAYGDAAAIGTATGRGPFVDLATAPDGNGFWAASAGGEISAVGSARPQPALPSAPAAPLSAIEATPGGDGVWLAAGGDLLGQFGVTCYALQGTTASGAPVGNDVVAVDPRSIPLGSEVFVGGLGIKRALDTGGAIKGRRLDIWNPSSEYCRQFGMQQMTAYSLS